MVEPEFKSRYFHVSCTYETQSEDLKKSANSSFCEPRWNLPLKGHLLSKWLGTDLSFSRFVNYIYPNMCSCACISIYWILLAKKQATMREPTFFFGIEQYNEFHLFHLSWGDFIYDFHFVLISPWNQDKMLSLTYSLCHENQLEVHVTSWIEW